MSLASDPTTLLPLDTTVFTDDPFTQTLSYASSDLTKVGLYTLHVSVFLTDYPAVTTGPHVPAFQLEI